MQKLDGILKEVIVQVLVKVQQELKWDFFGIDHFLDWEVAVVAVSIKMVSLDNSWTIPSREEEVVSIASWLPSVLVNNLFTVVVNEVDRSFLNLTFLMSESMENRDSIHAKAVNELVIVAKSISFNIKFEFSLPDSGNIIALSGINNIVVVDNSILVLALVFVIHLIG